MDLEAKLHKLIYSREALNWHELMTVAEAARKIRTKQEVVVSLVERSTKLCLLRSIDIGSQTYVISKKSNYLIEKMWST